MPGRGTLIAYTSTDLGLRDERNVHRRKNDNSLHLTQDPQEGNSPLPISGHFIQRRQNIDLRAG